MTEKVLEGIHESPQFAERYFKTMDQAIEHCRWIEPKELAINPVILDNELHFKLTYVWKDGSR